MRIDLQKYLHGAGLKLSYKLAENLSVNTVIVEQKDRLFMGNLTFPSENGTKITEDLSGVIGLDNMSPSSPIIEIGLLVTVRMR